MMLQTVRSDGIAAQPWRNGGGQTRELLAWPAAGDWLLRVSLADIAADGPFSAFPGVQRWFAVLEGAGVWLDIGGRTLRLDSGSPPQAFDGAEAPACRLIDGPTRDLNLMARSDAVQAGMSRVEAGRPWQPGPGWRGLFCDGPGQLLAAPDRPALTELPAFSLTWSADAQGPWTWQSAAGARAWWLHVESPSAAQLGDDLR